MTGTAAPALYGLCESQYNPNLSAEELVQTAGVLKYVFAFSLSFCQLKMKQKMRADPYLFMTYIYREVFPCGIAEGRDERRLRAHIHSDQGLHLLERSFFQRYLTTATPTTTRTEGN